MANIYFNITGNGTAYCTPSAPTIGESFDFFAVPFDSDTLVDVTCTNDNGESVAVPVATTFTLTMPNVMYLTFNVIFTGGTPPTPPTPSRRRKKRMPIWMYPMFRS